MSLRRALPIALLALVAFGVAGYANREAIILSAYGAMTKKRTLDEQIALLEPSVRVYPPAKGRAPYPTVIQFHGCAGYRPDFMEQWARVANEAGFLVIGVDSNTPRGVDRETALETICKGKKLIGQERAGDVAAALAIAARRADVDQGRIILAGWSHGAWSVMDYLALTGAGAKPPSVKGKLAPAAIAGFALFYPYCGEGTWSRLKRWTTTAPVLAFIAGKDTIVDGPECKARLESLKSAGADIEIVYYPDADHVFDDRGLAHGVLGEASKRFFSKAAADDAEARYRAFLSGS